MIINCENYRMLKSLQFRNGLFFVINSTKYSREDLCYKSKILSNNFIHSFVHNTKSPKRKHFCSTFCWGKYSFVINLSTRSTLGSEALVLNSPKLEQYLKHINSDILHSKFNFSVHRDHLVFKLLKEKEILEENLKQLESEKDGNVKVEDEMLELIEEDVRKYTTELKNVYEKMTDYLIPKEDFEECNDIVLEISAGVGGVEAMLFAGELRNMYCGYSEYKGWQYSLAESDESELGGVRHCSLLLSGPGVYSVLQHEAGVHRVQRVPATERTGRMHTSTVTVAVLPQPSDIDINLKERDLKIETKRASGAGGQHVNTTDSAVRVTHIPSGIVVECQSGRSQIQNRTNALKRLQAKIYERELTQMDYNTRNQRKSQVGTSSRSEKIRTYNFRDDRISDHRMVINLYNMRKFLEGGESLEKLLSELIRKHRDLRVQLFIDSLPL